MNAAAGPATAPDTPSFTPSRASTPAKLGQQPHGHDSRVVVLGSANLDIVFTVDRIPQPGETLLAESADRYAGGKGLNQAVAAARAGSNTVFIGALGDDEDGAVLSEVLTAAGITQELVRRSDLQTGQAFIVVDSAAENTIVVASGANGSVVKLTAPDKAAIAAASVLLMQLELPMAVVVQAAEYARSVGTTVILNAAPAQQLPPPLLCHLDFLVVNEHEVCLIGGSPDPHSASVSVAATVAHLVVTLGAEGSVLWKSGSECARIPAVSVTALDTTGAGDTYCGAFAAALAEGQPVEQAAVFAAAAAALSVQVIGAVPSVPARAAIDQLLAK